MQKYEQGIVFFDGICNLCNGFVKFIIRNDSRSHFRFASLQSKEAVDFFKKHNLCKPGKSSVILYYREKFYFQSSAVLGIAKNLDGLFKFLYVFIIIPAFIRNSIYNFIATHRYGWFGKMDTCVIPDDSIKNRFLVFRE